MYHNKIVVKKIKQLKGEFQMSNFVKQFQNNNSRPLIPGSNAQASTATAPDKREKRNKAKIVVERTEFDGTVKSKSTTTVKLCHMINQLFKAAFDDYSGCDIEPDHTGTLQVVLYFRAGNTTKTSMVQPVTTVSKNSTMNQKLQALHARTESPRKFEMSTYGKEILEDFVYPNKGNQYNWNELSFEVPEQTYSGVAVYLKVYGVNLNRVISTIYGKGTDETRFEYNIQIIRPLMGKNYLVSIQQLNCAEVEELCREFGMQQQVGTLQMVRA